MTARAGPDTGGPGPSGLPVGDLLTSEPITVDIPVPASALAIGAHPDDIEFGCGSTLARWASSGCRVHHLILTDGSKGSWDPGADLVALVAERQAECRTAGDVIDGHPGTASSREDRVLFLGPVDGELENGVDERREMARIIRMLRPEIVLGHDPWRRYRLHPDHRAAGFITLDGVVAARDPHFFPELELSPHRPEGLLLFEADQPNHVEDADGFEDTKVEALLCHRSQWESTMHIGPENDAPSPSTGVGESGGFAAKVRRQLAGHGSLSGLGAAEAFHLITEV
jgi:LmbE family N-acetylglucosaminyl deacetylase